MNQDDPDRDLPDTELPTTEAFERVHAESKDSIGPYRLLQKIGEGGMGEVWLAEQTEPVRRRVALKVIKLGRDSKQVVARFEAERQALAMMEHPAVAKVFDAGTTPFGRPFFVMEYVKGVPITEYCDRNRLSNRERLGLFCLVCEGVQHAHQKAIIHRDLKPSNVLVTEQDGHRVPKIIDFGLAKATAQKLTEKTMFTELGVLLGTPEYMSPEQANLTGEDVDTRTDVYSLGVMLYELLVGALPLDSKELRSGGFDGIRRTLREREPPRPSMRLSTLGDSASDSARLRGMDLPALRRQLVGDLDWITLKALEKDRARRYATPIELARDLERHLANEPVLASPPSVSYRVGKFVRRHRAGVITAAVLALAMLGGVVGTTIELVRARRAEAEARRQSAASDRVSHFLADMLGVVDPQRMGKNLKDDIASRVASAGSLDKVNMVDVSQTLVDREILSPASTAIDSTLRSDPRTAYRLHSTIGDVYLSGLQLYERAVDSFRKAEALGRQAFGDEAEETNDARYELATALSRLGGRSQREESQSLLLRVVTAERKTRAEDDPTLLGMETMLADSYRYLGRNAEAEKQLREIIPRLRRVKPDSSGEAPLYYALNDLAYTIRAQKNKQAEAESLYRESIAGLTRLLGPGDFETLNVRLNYARLLSRMGRGDEALSYTRDLLVAERKYLGSETDRTLQTLAQLGLVLSNLGRYDEAVVAYSEAVRGGGRFPLSSLWLTDATTGLATSLAQTGRYASGEKLLTDYVSRIHDANDPDLASNYREAIYSLATIAARHGDRAKGLDWVRQLIDAGFNDPAQLADDPDLGGLHGAQFEALLARAKANGAGGN
jgi:non-specific serine/threonine protein kinase/serine/threonine-protein kinase